MEEGSRGKVCIQKPDFSQVPWHSRPFLCPSRYVAPTCPYDFASLYFNFVRTTKLTLETIEVCGIESAVVYNTSKPPSSWVSEHHAITEVLSRLSRAKFEPLRCESWTSLMRRPLPCLSTSRLPCACKWTVVSRPNFQGKQYNPLSSHVIYNRYVSRNNWKWSWPANSSSTYTEKRVLFLILFPSPLS